MLMMVLTTILLHFIYYYFYYTGVIKYTSNLAYSIVPVATIVPLVVYYYVLSVIYGKINFTTKSLLHFVPLLLIGIIFIFYINSDIHKQTLLFTAKSILISLYILYPFIIAKTIANFYNQKRLTWRIFKFNKKKTALIKLLLYLMVLHFFILVLKNNLPLFIDGSEKIMDIINLCFIMFLGYAVSYVIISEPKSLYQSEEKVGLVGFKKYEKSSLTHSKAINYAAILNRIMKEEKPYLDMEFDMAKLSEQSGVSSHCISETLNGLIGQSFNDFVNNYRVEEFKVLAAQDKHKEFTILAIAFEAGFKSKATFNASFKKFTNLTPSQFVKNIT